MSATGQGSVASITFSGIETVNAGDDDDTFIFADGAALTTGLDAGNGFDVFDASADTTGFTVDLGLQTSTLTGGFIGVDRLLGGTGSDTLVGPDLSNVWDITANDTGEIVGVAEFVSFENLTGGSSNDRMVFADGVGVTGVLTGSGGEDTLDYTAYTTSVAVDLSTNTASAVGGGVFTFENITGGSAADDLMGDSADNIIVGNDGNDVIRGLAGNDLLEGNGDQDFIEGGDGDDALFGGDGNDILDGGNGDDLLDGGPGNDALLNSPGDDTFLNLLAAEPASASAAVTRLTYDALDPIVDEAMRRWASMPFAITGGVDFEDVTVHIVDLPDQVLGRTFGQHVLIDPTAAGHGWFVDATPLDDAEFTVNAEGVQVATSGPAAEGMDLLSVLSHELGHVLGHDDLDAHENPHQPMAGTLNTGERRSPGSTLVFDSDSGDLVDLDPEHLATGETPDPGPAPAPADDWLVTDGGTFPSGGSLIDWG